MHLLLRRSQRDDGWLSSSIMFILDTRLDLTPEEADLFDKYGLHDFTVYDSEPRTHHGDTALDRFNKATDLPIWDPSFYDLAASLWNNAVGTTHSLLGYLSLRITFADLIAGQHVECESLEQLLSAEGNIVEAVEYLANYFGAALTFDGREDLREL
jgi:hypothetical protein